MLKNVTKGTDFPVRYVLFSHYANSDFGKPEDYEDWREHKPDVRSLGSFPFLVSHLRGLNELLTVPNYEGILVLFFDPGFADFLKGVGQQKSKQNLLQEIPALLYAEAMKQAMTEELEKHGDLSRRVRFVTALDLYPLFQRWHEAHRLRRYFMGRTEAMRYDSPKIIEAIVRVRLIGNGIPVFRLDHDVIFRGEDNCSVDSLGMFDACAKCLRAYEKRRDDPRISTFLFSAQYDTRRVETNPGEFDSWYGAYATRAHPSLIVDIGKMAPYLGRADADWTPYAQDQEIFNETLTRRFYGFPDKGELAINEPRGMAKLGAHPLVSVISGAMLCLSESAIVDLPPFSGFRHNVSFIDDHQKYCLHRELRHFTTISIVTDRLLNDAKLDAVKVRKFRGPIKGLPAYTLGTYLPTLLWGCVMDAWINAHHLLKFRPEGLSPVDREVWGQLKRRGLSDGVFPRALQSALESGSLSYNEEDDLRIELEKIALQRIEEVRQDWAQLNDDEHETFASLWAKGIVLDHFPKEQFDAVHKNSLCAGIAPRFPLSSPVTADRMNPALLRQLAHVIEDTTEYIEWTLNWPQVIQVIRSVEPGTLPTDLSWPK